MVIIWFSLAVDFWFHIMHSNSHLAFLLLFFLCQLAMTHPSHHLNFGMNPDHARNSLSNCGIRQPKYGDRKVHHMFMRKKG